MRRAGIFDGLFQLGANALGSYRQRESAEAAAALDAAEKADAKRTKWRELDIQNAGVAERQRAAVAGETLRQRELDRRAAESKTESERRAAERAADLAYRAAQLELSQSRLGLSRSAAARAERAARERPPGGAAPMTARQRMLMDKIQLYTKPVSQGGLGMSLEAANRRARLSMGETEGLSAYDLLDAEEARREQARAAGGTLPGQGAPDFRRDP